MSSGWGGGWGSLAGGEGERGRSRPKGKSKKKRAIATKKKNGARRASRMKGGKRKKG